SPPHRLGVRGQALGGGERLDGRAYPLEPLPGQTLHRDRLQERLEPEAADRTRPTAGREHVVGARAEVARGHRRPLADADGPGVANPRRERLRLAEEDEM